MRDAGLAGGLVNTYCPGDRAQEVRRVLGVLGKRQFILPVLPVLKDPKNPHKPRRGYLIDCPLCPRRFDRRSELLKHLQKANFGKLPEGVTGHELSEADALTHL